MIMQGLYDEAIESYQNALIKRPGWLEAEQNLQIARLRKEALAPPDDDYGGTGGQLGADEIVFDDTGRNMKSSGEEVLEATDQQQDEEAMRAMWLRKVETRPADFLAARFYYQLVAREREAVEGIEVDQEGTDND
jgi:Ca-activated chloride channel family protein